MTLYARRVDVRWGNDKAILSEICPGLLPSILQCHPTIVYLRHAELLKIHRKHGEIAYTEF